MKKLNPRNAGICLLLFSLALFNACKDDDDDKPEEIRLKKLTSYVDGALSEERVFQYTDGRLKQVRRSYEGQLLGNILFDYNSQGRLVKVHNDWNGLSQSFSYEGNKVYCIAQWSDQVDAGFYGDSIALTLDSKGLPIHSTITLRKSSSSLAELLTYSWHGGLVNTKKVTYVRDGSVQPTDSMITETVYSGGSAKNPFWGLLDEQYPFLNYSSWLGEAPVFPISQFVGTEARSTLNGKVNNTAEIKISEKNDYPIKLEERLNSRGKVSVRTTHYDYYGI